MLRGTARDITASLASDVREGPTRLLEGFLQRGDKYINGVPANIANPASMKYLRSSHLTFTDAHHNWEKACASSPTSPGPSVPLLQFKHRRRSFSVFSGLSLISKVCRVPHLPEDFSGCYRDFGSDAFLPSLVSTDQRM